jgi:hypothetical protein
MRDIEQESGSVDPAAGMDAAAEPYAEPLPQTPRDPRPEPGDPPAAVRGNAQALIDPLGDAADDGSPRWDPRTQSTDQREGG